MKLVWITPNQQWCFAFGDSLVRLYFKEGGAMPMFFNCHGDAVQAAESVGLVVSKRTGKVSVKP